MDNPITDTQCEHFFPEPEEFGYDPEAFPAERGNCACGMTWADHLREHPEDAITRPDAGTTPTGGERRGDETAADAGVAAATISMGDPALARAVAENAALVTSLQAAVPLHVFELSRLPDDERLQLAQRCADVVAAHGDDLMFGGPNCAETFNALARGLALLSMAPGGVTFAEQHWCTQPHEACPRPRSGILPF